MASTINTTNIDETFPIAGQDNDSQGFRDNFTNINTNFTAAKEEITDLQNKVLLKSALVGGTLNNDLNGALLSNATLVGTRESIIALGSVVPGALSIDALAAQYQSLTLTGATTLDFNNSFSGGATFSSVTLEVQITNLAYTLTLPAEVTIGLDGLQNLSGSTITFSNIGTYILEFSSTDGGASIAICDKSQPRIPNRQKLVSAPATSMGASGDRVGMMAWDGTYMYLCTADYNGVSNIWVRASAATW